MASSLFGEIVGLIQPIPVANWAFTGPSGHGSVTRQVIHLIQAGALAHVEFDFTDAAGIAHTLVTDVSTNGTATIALDNVPKTAHPKIRAGTALMWHGLTPVPTVIVHILFDDAAGKELDYRFQGHH